MATSFKNRKTPGVYVTEYAAFPPSVVGVATAVPIFVGYTETAMDPSSKKQLYLQAVPIESMADYYSYFGHGFDAKGVVDPAPVAGSYDFEAASSNGKYSATSPTFTETKSLPYLVGTTSGTPPEYVAMFNLYSAMQMFYANGGGSCFVISVDNYWGTQSVAPPAPPIPPVKVKKDPLMSGLAIANETRGATMLVVPDACLLVAPPVNAGDPYTYDDYQPIAVEMLRQSATLQDRVAILDLPGALVPANWNVKAMEAEAAAFYTAIAPAQPYFSYGAAYGPAVETSLLTKDDVLYTNLTGTDESKTLVNALLTTQALKLYPPTFEKNEHGVVIETPHYTEAFQNVAARIAYAFPAKGSPVKVESVPPDITETIDDKQVSHPNPTVYPPPAPDDLSAQQALDQYLLNALPLLKQIQQILASHLNVVPPSGIMAGVWTQNDANRGVWNAPANITLNEVIAPMVALSDDQQGDYNMPLNGNAIDILRPMVNRGTVVWGARTLDGNSLDYRYIQVRRTLIYIEQSIKLALQQFVFAPNDGGTWATVTATISNFLTQLWQAGGLMGDKASDAFTVQCGVPTTMSGLDVLNGYMVVNVKVQMIHPAEFIELTFTQTMQGV
ncbi:MAG TPA: phage tail sheath C-terminal domain-containing protein [Allosphingosinicella sp.]|nr:phage tail sheath C-terminal domain-containing protein [Allosphingosinicella sp.]